MAELHAMPYQYSPHWQTPTEVNLTQVADCKGKAVALYTEMRRNGAQNLRIVIGKHHLYNSVTHAWLEWDRPEGSFTLDPTFNETPIRTTELDPMSYLPFYAYDGARKYRVTNGGFLAPTTRVATGGSSHPYIPPTSATTLATPSLTGVGSRPLYPAATQYLNTSSLTLDSQRAWSHARSLSSRTTASSRQRGATTVMDTGTQYLVSAQGPIHPSSRKSTTLDRRRSVSSGLKRHVAHRGHRANRTRSTKLAASS
jgi:hypothetical protein